VRWLAEELSCRVVVATWNSILALSQVSVEAALFYQGIRIAKPQCMSVPVAVQYTPPQGHCTEPTHLRELSFNPLRSSQQGVPPLHHPLDHFFSLLRTQAQGTMSQGRALI